GPPVARQDTPGLGGEMKRRASMASGDHGQEMIRQRGQVRTSVPERGQRDVDDVQPEEEILAEAPRPHVRLEIAVRRGDHPDVDLDGHRAAEWLEATFLEKAE